MEALLVTGGDAPPRERLASRFGAFGLICAADSGLDTLRTWGLDPDIIVGDMDSVSDPDLVRAYPTAELHLASRFKDDTDTELGLSTLRERGADRIVLAGGGGGRLDHLLAIRALFERRFRPVEWHTAIEAAYLVEPGAVFGMEARPGSLVSIFPLSGGSTGMKSEGLAWPLAGLSWDAGGFGLSNVAVEGRFSLYAGTGALLVILVLG